MLIVSILDADLMAERQVSSPDGKAELFTPAKNGNWAWVNITHADGPIQLSVSSTRSKSEIIEFSRTSDPASRPTSWLIQATEMPIFLDALAESDIHVRCFGATLSDPLNALLETEEKKTSEAVVAMLDMICRDLPFDNDEFEKLDRKTGFELLRGCAAVARRLGLFETEADFLRRATDIRASPNQMRLLSYAYANAQNYDNAIIAAEAAVRSKPDLVEGPFRDHLAELKAYSDVGKELLASTAGAAKKSPHNSKAGYCLHNSLPYRNGGYAMRSHSLLSAMRAQNYDISAFVRPGFPIDGPPGSDRPSGRKSIDGVDYHFANMFSRNGRTYGYVLEAADYFEATFEAQNIGVVHAATNFWIGLPAALAAKRLGLPFIYEVRSFWAVTREAQTPGYQESPNGKRETALDNILLAMADAVVTLNDAMRQHIEATGVDPERITIIPNCVDLERFSAPEYVPALAAQYGLSSDDIVIGYLGAMLGYEGIDLLIEAVDPLITDNPKVKLVIVGGDPGKSSDSASVEYQLRRQVERLGLTANIIFVDRIPPGEAPNHYGLFDICAYPRRNFEVCELVSPLKPLEAMAAGKVVIISDVGGMSDIVEAGRTGLIFKKNDVPSLRSVLQSAIENTALRNRIENAARDFVREERSWANAATRLATVYEQAGTSSKPNMEHVKHLVERHFC